MNDTREIREAARILSKGEKSFAHTLSSLEYEGLREGGTPNFLKTLDICISRMEDRQVKMKLFSRFRADQRLPKEDAETAIRLYRRHAAQAISEERWPAAEIFFNRILEVSPGHTEAWLMKGWLRHHCRQDEATALECYQKVIDLCAHNSDHPHLQRAKKSLGHILAAAV